MRFYQGLIQTPAMFAFATDISTASFAKNLAYTLSHWKEATADFKDSPFMKSRGKKILVEMEEMSRKPEIKNFIQSRSFHDYLLCALTFGDRFTIVAGGSAMYRALREQGVPKEEALYRVSVLADKTQQSGRLTQQSLFQQKRGIYRLFTMYSSYSMQQARMTTEAVRGLLSGRMDKQKAFKQIFIYHFLVPQITQLMTNAILGAGVDKRDQLQAALLGSMNAIPIAGDVISYSVDTLTDIIMRETYGEDDEEPRRKKEVFARGIAARTVEELFKGGRTLLFDDPETEDVINAWVDIANLFTTAGAGVNLKTVKGATFDTVKYWQDEEYAKGVRTAMGFGKATVERAAEKGEK
jgi:hypothetical protein